MNLLIELIIKYLRQDVPYRSSFRAKSTDYLSSQAREFM
jgi:hypothetical protein